ncbi:MAG: methyltransferase domain-containing protein [Phycisphaerales bacterium]|nr:MAG: methyltransferase domain-containing protein [Phycisphaerales bacterium]
MATKHIVERNFSRHAGCYDAHTAVQKAIGARLVERLGLRSFGSILDVGCGTGSYTSLLHERYAAARIKGIDLSAEMVKVARDKLEGPGIEFMVGDAETATFDTPFDLITSNACFHWFSKLEETIAKCASALTEDGALVFSSLGPRTFWELGACLDAVLPAHRPISASAFVGRSELEAVLRRHFACVTVAEETMVEEYRSLLELLNTIKYAGARGSGLDGVALTKTLLNDLETEYRRRFGGIIATYQVFYGQGWKKGTECV